MQNPNTRLFLGMSLLLVGWAIIHDVLSKMGLPSIVMTIFTIGYAIYGWQFIQKYFPL